MDNKLKSFPKGFYNLTLKSLNISLNYFTELPLHDINASILETLIVERNPFYRLPNDLLKFQGLTSLQLGWLQYCTPPLSEPIAFSKATSCSNLTIKTLFEDFSHEKVPPSWITCFQILTKYSESHAWAIGGSLSLTKVLGSHSKLSWLTMSESSRQLPTAAENSALESTR